VPFSNGQNVQAADLNNLNITTVTTTGAVSVGTTLGVTGAATLSSTLGVTGATNVAALTASGTITPQGLIDASGASAGQIKFPATQNASADANTLDDYEEGSWTPTVTGSGGGSGQVYTVQVGWYVKVGKTVTAHFNLALSNKGTITTNTQIAGLPFTSDTTANRVHSCQISDFSVGAAGTALVMISGTLAPNSTAITLKGAGTAVTAPSNLSTAVFDTAISFIGSITYTATA
jgi:hypothetical protein